MKPLEQEKILINMLHNSCNLSGVMEAETISKNGASSKSHTSRGNILRKTSFALFAIGLMICGLLFTSCGSRGGSSGSGSPSSAVKNALNAYLKKDAETVFKYYYNLSDYQKESLRQELASDSDYNLVKFEIQDERIFDNGEKAEVIVKLILKNGNENTGNLQLVKTGSGWKLVRN